MKTQYGAGRHVSVFVRRLIFLERLAQERQRCAVSPGRRLNNVRDKAFFGQVVKVGHVFARPAMFRLAVFVQFQRQLTVFGNQLAFHVTSQVEVAAVSDAFQLAELARLKERIRVFDVRRAGGIVRQFRLFVIAQAQTVARQPHFQIPFVTAIAPEFVPLSGLFRRAEEFNFHLLEFAGTEREVSRSDFVAERFPNLTDAERDANAG